MARSKSEGSRARAAKPRSGGKKSASSKSSKRAPRATCSLGTGSGRKSARSRSSSEESDGGETCEVQVGFDPIDITLEEGMTIEQAFEAAAEELGLDTGSSVVYKSKGRLIDGSTLAKPGGYYSAVPEKSGKG